MLGLSVSREAGYSFEELDLCVCEEVGLGTSMRHQFCQCPRGTSTHRYEVLGLSVFEDVLAQV